jgi:hypothetical protein
MKNNQMTPGPKELAHTMALSVEQLAHRFVIHGKPVSRRTLYKWAARHAPFDSEASLRQWIANHGTPLAAVAPTLDQHLDKFLAQPAPNTTASRELSEDGKPTDTNPDGSAHSPAQLAALAQRDIRILQSEKLTIELAALRKELIPTTAVVGLVSSLAHEVLAGLTDLAPAVLKEIITHVPAEYRPRIRDAITQATATLRETLTTKAPELIQTAIENKGTK